MPQFKYYPGSKAVSGLYQWLINHMPEHDRFFSLFAGMGGVEYIKRPARFNWLSDLDEDCIHYHKETAQPGTHVCIADAFSILDTFPFTRSDLIYLDPPYPADARSTGIKYYKHEMLEPERHRQLLKKIKTVVAMVMISTRENELYSIELSDWRKEVFTTGSRSGAVDEIIYMNYPKPELLHQYDYLGSGNIKRQAIQRKRQAFQKKIAAMDLYQRHALIIEIARAFPAEVKHFLSLATGP